MKHTLEMARGGMGLRIPTSAQFRAARALLDWSLAEAARELGVSVSKVVRAEGRTPDHPINEGGPSIQAAFEAAGVVFTADGESVGVKLRTN